jgi:DNA topoisomerase-3
MFSKSPEPFVLDKSSLKSLKVPRSLPIFNETKVTDHHAIIPTLNDNWYQIIKKLSPQEYALFELIVRRFFGKPISIRHT